MKTFLSLIISLLCLSIYAGQPVKVVPVGLPDGSEAAPSLYFVSDPTTGFYLSNGVLCVTVHGQTVARMDKKRNVALAGAQIGAGSQDSLAAGRGSVADSDCAVALGQRNYAGAFDSVCLGHANIVTQTGVASFAVGADNVVYAQYAAAIGDANTIYESATGASAFGTSHFVGLANQSDRGQWSATFGVANQTLSIASLSCGLLVANDGDYSALFGQGINFHSPLTLTAPAVIGVGYNTTTPTIYGH